MGRVRKFLNRTVIPRTLFGRSLLIVVVPLVILQIVLTAIFYNRHWDTVTRWLAFGVAGEVALIVELLETTPERAAREALIDRIDDATDLRLTLLPDTNLAEATAAADVAEHPVGHIDNKILEGVGERLRRPFSVDLRPPEAERVASMSSWTGVCCACWRRAAG